ncbi:unnamed protein product [Heterobilharzia americana]|nr:unnamed protein product [Heterobilharzia americana]
MYKFEKVSRDSYQNNVKTIAIRNITEKDSKINVLGVVLQKQSVRRCTSNILGSTGSQAVLGFTLRDSASDWINGSYWGTFSNVSYIASQFTIGDCVIILNARVKCKEPNSYEDRFTVLTPSSYHLHMSERAGKILHYDFPDKLYTSCLKSSLVCSPAYHASLHQVIQTVHCKTSRTGEVFTFFAIVSEVKRPKTLIMARRKLKGEETMESVKEEINFRGTTQINESSEALHEVVQLCEVLLFDDTCSCLPMVLWNEEWIHIALTAFIQNSTVLSIVNCPVRYDHYRRGVVASPNSKTLIIISPDCTESNRLSQHAKHRNQKINLLRRDQNQFTNENFDEKFSQPLPLAYKTAQPEIYEVPLTSIHNILTIKELKEGKVVAGYACTFALITKIDLDCSNLQYLVTLQCTNCQGRLRLCDPPADYDITAPGKHVDLNQKYLFAMCNTVDCPISGQRLSWFDKQHVNLEYGTFVHLSDHTGTYSRCLLASIAMEKLLGCNVDKFLNLSMDKRVRLKWEICLRRFKVYFWTEQISYNNPSPLIVIIGVEKPNTFEVIQSLRSNKGHF